MSDSDFQFNPLALEQAVKLPQADTRPPTGQVDPVLARSFGAFGVIASEAPVARAAFETTLDEAQNVQAYRLDEGYRPVVEALAERTGKAKSHWKRGFLDRWDVGLNPWADTSLLDRDAIWRDVMRERAIDPKAFAELGNREDFEKNLLTRQGARAADEDLLARSRGLPATVATFAGALPASLARPENLAVIPIGGGAATFAGKLLTEGALNAGVAALSIPQTRAARAAMGEGYSGEQMLEDVGAAFAFGVATRGAIEGAPHVAASFRKAVPEPLRTPEEEAALHVVEREHQVEASSPYEHTYPGLDRHAAKLTEAMAEIEDGKLPVDRPPPTAEGKAAVRQAPGERDVGSAGGTLDGRIVALLERGGLSAEHARGVAAGIHAESASDPRALNPTSGAFGIGQWLGPRKEELFRRYGTNPTLEQQVEFLLWELRGGDAGGAKVLAQGDAASVLRSYIEDFMRPARGAETEGDLARGMAALGRAGEAAPGTAGAPAANPYADEAALALADEAADVELARVRADALEAEKPVVTSAGAQVPTATFRPDEIGVDAKLMQFKAGGDAQGVTERLKGVEEWDPIAAGMLTVWEDANGNRLIADGHQRLGLARRLGAESVNAFVLREADGFSARDARILAAKRNIGEGTGTASDAAKVFREAGPEAEPILKSLPPRSALVRDGKALARLSDEAFGAVVNEVIPEAQGAAIGHLAPDPATHLALVGLLARTAPSTRREAEAIVRQALDAGFTKETQNSLFGEAELVRGLYVERAKVLDRGLTALKQLKGAFTVAARNAGALETAGNRIDVAASEAAAAGNAQALGLVERLALRKGNAVNELLDEASRRLAAGEPLARVVRDFVAAVRQLDLADLERGADVGREGGATVGAGDGAERGGRGGEPAGQDEPALQDELTPAERDAAAEYGLFGDPPPPSPEQAKAFDSDAGDGVKAAAESDWHDIRAAQRSAFDRSPERALADLPDAQFAIAARELGIRWKAGSPRPIDRFGDHPRADVVKAFEKATAADPGGLALFDQANEPTFDLDDGKGPRTAAEIDAEIKTARAGLEAMRQCLK